MPWLSQGLKYYKAIDRDSLIATKSVKYNDY